MKWKLAADAFGFSLLELIVVLAILAMATALVVPQRRVAMDGAAVESAAIQLASRLRLARAETIADSQDKTVTLDLDKKTYWLGEQSQRQQIDQRIAVSLHDETFEWIGTARQIRFRPDGTATGGVIVLDDGNWQASVSLDWLTGMTNTTVRH